MTSSTGRNRTVAEIFVAIVGVPAGSMRASSMHHSLDAVPRHIDWPRIELVLVGTFSRHVGAVRHHGHRRVIGFLHAVAREIVSARRHHGCRRRRGRRSSRSRRRRGTCGAAMRTHILVLFATIVD